MKGPAAATLYGIQASNGVVRITTKHGTAGPARWNLFCEFGGVRRQQYLSAQLRRARHDAPTDRDFDGFCSIQCELDGVCTQTVGAELLSR